MCKNGRGMLYGGWIVFLAELAAFLELKLNL